MRRSLKGHFAFITIFAIVVFAMVIGCSSKEKLETQVSGSWQRTQGDGMVEINLDKKPISLVFNGKTYAPTIDKVDKGNNSVHLKVETDDGTTEEWILHQMWNDNGSTFKLAFRHNGTQETLVHASKS
jgi:hypothetical protein